MTKNSQELYDKLMKASDIIANKHKNCADFLIVSASVAEAIENLDIKKHRKKKLIKINEISEKTSE